MGLRGRLRRLQREADKDLLTFRLKDGTVARFSEEAFMECFLHEHDRGRAHYFGEPVPPAHPLVLALRNAEDLDELAKQHGTIVAAWVGEDEILRGERERPGPPVEWNDDGTVCG